jgi:hypothetical protein
MPIFSVWRIYLILLSRWAYPLQISDEPSVEQSSDMINSKSLKDWESKDSTALQRNFLSLNTGIPILTSGM